MDSTSVGDCLMNLKRLEQDLEAPMNVQVHRLRLKASLLKTFLKFSEKSRIEHGKLKALLARVRTQFLLAIQDIQLWVDIRVSKKEDRRVPAHVDGGNISWALEKIELTKMDVHEVYNMLAYPSRSVVVISDELDLGTILDFLLDDTEDLLINSKGISILPVKKELESVAKSLRFLKSFLLFTGIMRRPKDLSSQARAVAHKIACLLYLCAVHHKMADQTARKMKMELQVQLEKIKPVQPETREAYIKALKDLPYSKLGVCRHALGALDAFMDNMIELCETKFSFITSIKEQILALLRVLKFSKYYIIVPLRTDSDKIFGDQQFDYLCEHANSLIIETGYVTFSLCQAEKNEDVAEELKSAQGRLLAKCKDAKAYARKRYEKLVPKSIQFDFPRTNFQGFISSLLRNLEDLIRYSKDDTVAAVKHDIDEVQKELLCLRDDCNDIAKILKGHQELNHQWTRLIDVTYQAEYVIDSFFVQRCLLFDFRFGLFAVIKEIKMIRKELKNVLSEMTSDDPSTQEISNFPDKVSSEPDSLPNNMLPSSSDYETDGTDGWINSTPQLVAFEDGAEKILEQLTSDEKELQIVSIVGLPGIGKTTLANSLYDHPLVKSCFRVRATICVSKVYQRRKLLLEILQGTTGETENFVKMGDKELEHKLSQSLQCQRYLILMDDIWDIRPWLDIKASLPDNKNGSRIMFTSRSHNIASQAKKKSITYQLDLLSDEKGWEMLHSKICEKEDSCPPELVAVGKEIAQSCKGLPLTIDLIAGVLKTTERKEYCWQQVAKDIMTQVGDDPQQRCQKILELSYSDLPDYLKPCFLYFGAFPEDTEVPVKRLIWLWIAEGFVQLQQIDQSMEKAAEAYLNDLISRSLVIVSKRTSLGGAKASRIHDLLHDFASSKAIQDCFLLQMKGQDNPSHLSLYGCRNEGYRMFCDSKKGRKYAKSSGSLCRVRSILFYLSQMTSDDHQFLNSNFGRFRLLRVLDIQSLRIRETIYCAMRSMLHLKFIALSYYTIGILSLLPRFHKLETILLAETTMILSVDNIWDLLKLKHFHIGYFVLRLPMRNCLTESFQLANLQTLSTLCLHCNEETESMMRRLPNLQKLSCAVYDSCDSIKNCNLFPKLNFLKQLYSLKLSYVGKVPHPAGKFSFPPYLKKLTLSEFRLPWSQISAIAALEHLEVLRLRNHAFEGDIWHMRDGEFPKLRVLSLWNLGIQKWNAEEVEDNLPPLEHLEVLYCENLVELPFCLANIPTLKAIRLWRCSSSVETSAEKIVAEQKANVENDELEIIPHPTAKTGWWKFPPLTTWHGPLVAICCFSTGPTASCP